MIVLSDLDRSGGFAPRSFAAGSAASGTNRVNQRLVARRYEDLDAWHLADQLRQEVFALTETGTASKDFKFRDQIRDAASSSARNIAEGFGRFRPPDFARFMEFSIASTMEVRDLLIEASNANASRLPRQKLPLLSCAARFRSQEGCCSI